MSINYQYNGQSLYVYHQKKYMNKRKKLYLVDSLERDTVKFIGTSDQEETGFQLFKEDNAFASVFTGEEDQHLTGLDSLFQGGLGGDSSRSTEMHFFVISFVPLGHFASNSCFFLRCHN